MAKQPLSLGRKAHRNKIEAGELYRRLFLQSNDAIILHELGGNIVEVNAKACALLCCSEAELIGKPLGALVRFETKIPSPEIHAALKRDGGVRFDATLLQASGKQIAIEISSSLIDAESGLVQGCIRDVSQRRRETERNELRTKISTLLEFLEPGHIEMGIDRACGLIAEYAGCERIHVYWRHTDAEGVDLVSNVNEWCAPGIVSIKSGMQKLPTSELPYWFKRLENFEDIHINDLNEIPAEAHSEHEFFKRMHVKSLTSIPMVHAGKLVGFIGLVFRYETKNWEDGDLNLLRNIAESIANHRMSNLVQSHLRRSQTRMREFEELLPDFVYEVDLEGNFTFVSDNAYKLSGYSRETLLTKTRADALIHPCDRERAHKNLARLMKGEYIGKNEYLLLRKDGSTLPIIAHSKPAYDGDKVIGLRGIFTDISKYKDAEDRLRSAHEALVKINQDLVQARQAAEDVSQSKSEFLAFIGHEIRTPLNAVLGILDILGEAKMPAEQVEYMRILRVSANSLMEILNDILDFSRAEAGKMELIKVRFEPAKVIEQSVRLIEAMATQKGLGISVDIDPRCSGTFVGDEGRVQQIMLNLVNNAVKYTNSGSIRVCLICEGRSDGNAQLRFEVADTGIGIAREKLDLIFDRFSQGGGKGSGEQPGSGLGLTISRQLAELMGGSIGVESELGQGSRFWVLLPMECMLADEPECKPEALKPEDASIPRIEARVLLVEDDEIIQHVASTILERIGCSVVIAGDGVAALEEMERSHYDLIFMDCQMPRLSGMEATVKIREIEGDGPRTPIIALTANALEGDKENCFAAGMDDYICKPVSAAELRQMARKWYTAAREAGA